MWVEVKEKRCPTNDFNTNKYYLANNNYTVNRSKISRLIILKAIKIKYFN